MKLFHIKRLDGIDYDEYDAFVVRAEDETAARQFASKEKGCEREDVWLDERLSDCTELTPDGQSGIILGSYNAG